MLVLVSGLIQQRGWDGDHMGWGWGGWVAMIVMMVLFWGGLLLVGALLVRGVGRHHQVTSATAPPTSDPAMDIARERYARGEMDEEEFQRIKRGLS